MNMKAIGLAILAGAVGALAWAAVIYYFDYELGYLAWAIGGLVGFAARGAGEGKSLGVACAVIALVSMFAGKFMGMAWYMDNYREQQMEEAFTEDQYRLITEEAKAFAALESEDQYPEFMVRYEYSEASSPAEVGSDELEVFKSDNAPYLLEMADPPPYEEWKEGRVAHLDEFYANQFGVVGLAALVAESLSGIDLIFGLFGAGTAYQLVTRRREDQQLLGENSDELDAEGDAQAGQSSVFDEPEDLSSSKSDSV